MFYIFIKIIIGCFLALLLFLCNITICVRVQCILMHLFVLMQLDLHEANKKIQQVSAAKPGEDMSAIKRQLDEQSKKIDEQSRQVEDQRRSVDNKLKQINEREKGLQELDKQLQRRKDQLDQLEMSLKKVERISNM